MPEALQAQPLPRVMPSQELSMQYKRAQTAYRSGSSLREAKARVDRVLREAPEHADARLLRAKVLLRMERNEEALLDARAALRNDPQSFEAHVILTEAARLSGADALALRTLQAAAAIVVDDAALHLRLAWNAMAMEEVDHAEAFARIALRQDEQQPLAWLQLAKIFLLQDRTDDAAMILQKGMEQDVLVRKQLEADEMLWELHSHPELAPWLE